MTKTQMELQTTMGLIVVELDTQKVPLTCRNFLDYANDGFYNGTIFHRTIAGFMIQGGGHLPDMTEKSTKTPIKNESSNGLSNLRGTIAMARTSSPHSATAQFFINVADNKRLDYTQGKWGYAVFGTVTRGMDVVDRIVSVKTTDKGHYANVPVEPIIINSTKVIEKKDAQQ